MMPIRNYSKHRPNEILSRKIKRRTGITRHTLDLTIKGVRVKQIMGAPVTVRERIIHVPRTDFYRGAPKGVTYHFALQRFLFQAWDGSLYSVMRCITFTTYGSLRSVSGFFNLIRL